MPLRCPSCDCSLTVNKLVCKDCGTEVVGDFDLPVIARLSHKEQKFILDFIKSSGSLKDMAKNMGVSYPTIRNCLDELIENIEKLEE